MSRNNRPIEKNDPLNGDDQIREIFESNLPLYQNYGKLGHAQNAHEYCSLYKESFRKLPGLFEFIPERALYYSSLKKRGDNQYIDVKKCGNFTIKVLSFLKDSSNPSRPDFNYLLQVIPSQGKPLEIVATSRDLADVKGFKNFLLSTAKIAFEGNNDSATAISVFITQFPAPEIRAMMTSGYDHASECYIFKNFGIGRQGEILFPDKSGLFKLSGGATIKPAPIDNTIYPAAKGPSVKEIYSLIQKAWGDKATAIFAWMVASWFVHHIREKLNFMPFALLHGETQTGKTFLSTILNNCQGFTGEGLGVSTFNSATGLTRILATASSHFMNLCEDNERDDKRKFNWGNTLTWYNHQADLFIKGAFSNDLRTRSAKFLGTLMISGNRSPLQSTAERERACFFEFKQDDVNESTLQAYHELNAIPSPELARVIQLVLKKRKTFESKWYAEYQQAKRDLSSVKNQRILQNFSVILCFHRLFTKSFNIDHDITSFLQGTATFNAKAIDCSSLFDPAEHFFETLNEFPEEKTAHCMLVDPAEQRLYINLPAVEILFKREKWMFSVNENIGNALQRHPSFIAKSVPKYFPAPIENIEEGPKKDKKNQKRAWVFDTRKLSNQKYDSEA